MLHIYCLPLRHSTAFPSDRILLHLFPSLRLASTCTPRPYGDGAREPIIRRPGGCGGGGQYHSQWCKSARQPSVASSQATQGAEEHACVRPLQAAQGQVQRHHPLRQVRHQRPCVPVRHQIFAWPASNSDTKIRVISMCSFFFSRLLRWFGPTETTGRTPTQCHS